MNFLQKKISSQTFCFSLESAPTSAKPERIRVNPRNPRLLFSSSSDHRQGFTLLELMIVIVILGILATIIMPKIMNRPDQARRTKAVVEIRNIENALNMYRTDTGDYPTTGQGLAALVSNPGAASGYNDEGYLDKLPVDPWGNNYVYLCPGAARPFDLKSFGKDGEPGGSGLDADIEHWNLEANVR